MIKKLNIFSELYANLTEITNQEELNKLHEKIRFTLLYAICICAFVFTAISAIIELNRLQFLRYSFINDYLYIIVALVMIYYAVNFINIFTKLVFSYTTKSFKQ